MPFRVFPGLTAQERRSGTPRRRSDGFVSIAGVAIGAAHSVVALGSVAANEHCYQPRSRQTAADESGGGPAAPAGGFSANLPANAPIFVRDARHSARSRLLVVGSRTFNAGAGLAVSRLIPAHPASVRLRANSRASPHD